MRDALEEALARYVVAADVADASSPVAAVLAAAPDLVVLVGDAARAHVAILTKLAANALTAGTPVALLAPEGLDVRLSAARFGVALVPRTASADEMAGQIARLAREMPERSAHSGGAVGEGTLEELLDILKRELQGGILSVSQEGEGARSARFVLRPGRNVEVAIRDFVKRIKPLLRESRPLHYELDDPGTGKLAVLDEDGDDGDRTILRGRRILLVEDDAATADALAQELRAQGSIVAVCTSVGGGLERAHTLDPEVILVDESALDGEGYAVLRTVRRDLALRWASILVARLRELFPSDTAPRMDRLAGSLSPLLAPDREIAELALGGKRFEARLESLGASRLLRAVAASGGTFHIVVRHPRAVVELDVAEGLIAGAEAMPMGGAAPRVAGTAAISALLALGSGRVSVEPREAPSTANLLMPVGDAIVAAAKEVPPIRPSIPPFSMAPRAMSHAPPASSYAPGAPSVPPPPALMNDLKRVLERLRDEGFADELLSDMHSGEHDISGLDDTAPTATREALPEAPPTAPRRKQTLVGMPAPSLPFEDHVPSTERPPALVPPMPATTPKITVPKVAMPPKVATPKAPSVPKPAAGAVGAARTPAAGAPRSPRSVPPPPPPVVALVAGPEARAAASAPARVDPRAASSPARPEVRAASSSPAGPEVRAASAPAVHSTSNDTSSIEVTSAELEATGPTQSFDAFDIDALEAPDADEVSSPSEPSKVSVTAPVAKPVAVPAAFEAAAPALDASEGRASHRPNVPDIFASPSGADGSPSVASLDALELGVAPKRRWAGVAAAVVLLVVLGGAAAWYFTRPVSGGEGLAANVAGAPAGLAEQPAPTGAPGVASPATERTPEASPEGTAPPGAPAAVDESGSPSNSDDGSDADATEGSDADATDGIDADPTEGSDADATDGSGGEATEQSDDADGSDDAAEGGDEQASGDGSSRSRLENLVSSGNFFRGRNRLDRARRAYESALAIAPQHGPALAGLTKVAIAQRRGSEAVGLARRLVAVNRNNAGNHVLLGDALMVAGDRAGARRAWEDAARINPRHRTARSRLGR